MREKVNLFLLIVFTGLAFFYKGWHEGFASTFIFYVVFLITIYEAVLLFTLYGLRVEREIKNRRLTAGADQAIKIRLKRKFPIPFVWYIVYEDCPSEGSLPQRQFIFPWFKREIELHYLFSNLPRGLYRLHEIKIETGDFFGFMRMSRFYSVESQFIVLPHYSILDQWTVKDGQQAGRSSLSHRSSTDQTALSSIRDYQYGDRLSQINWKVSARTQSLKTKEFEFQASDHFSIFLDTAWESYQHSQQFEQAVSLAASLIHFASRRKMKFSLQTGGRGVKLRMLEGSLAAPFHRYMECLAMIELESGLEFTKTILQKQQIIPKGTHLVFITSKVDRLLVTLLSDLVLRKWKVELYYICSNQPGTEEEWITTLQANGVICHRETA